MPDLSGIRTSIASGSTFNITWFTAFPHHVCAYDPNAPFGRQLRYSFQGGYRIEVLNEKEEPIAVLTSTDGAFVGENDATYANHQSSARHFNNHPLAISRRDSQTVTLPADLECSNCAIRLVRQATEWGSEYQFFSCADVNIVKCGQ